jgi:DNA-binding XRE family transcriptional regulator
MGVFMAMRVFSPPSRGLSLPGLRVERTRPRAFSEWAALRRWGMLPSWEKNSPGYLLRLAREEAGLTQAALAKALRCSQQAIAQAERWESNPTCEYVETWAEACGKRMEIVFRQRGGPPRMRPARLRFRKPRGPRTL